MNFEFPKLKNLSEFLPHIVGRDDFIHVDKGWYSYIDRVYTSPVTFLNPMEPGISEEEKLHRTIMYECNGVIFNPEGELLSRPYHKIHNLNERPEAMFENVDWDREHIFLNKEDGSMIRPLYHEEAGDFRFGTKAGVTNVGMNAEVFVADKTKYRKFARELFESDLTPMFEWVSEINKIVVSYNQEDLILTGIRHTYSGQYLSFEKMEGLAYKYDIPLVNFLNTSMKLEKLIQSIADSEEDIEGYIVRFNNGHMLKTKTNQYCLFHSSKEKARNKRVIFRHIVENTLDDLKPTLAADELSKVERWETEFFAIIDERLEFYKSFVAAFDLVEAREFAMNHIKQVSPFEGQMILAHKNGKDLRQQITKELTKHVYQNKEFDKLERIAFKF